MQDAHTFIKPIYEDRCFSCIPNTILREFGENVHDCLSEELLPTPSIKYEKIVFIYVDAFGWKFFEKYKDKYPSLKRFLSQGVASKITSQFPSTAG